MISYCSMLVHVKKGSLNITDIKTPYDEIEHTKPELSEQEIQKQLQEAKAFWDKQDKKKNGKTDY